MKHILKITTATLLMAATTIVSISSAHAGYVNGYVKSNGTYVGGHFRSAPDNSIYNNYSYWK